MQLRARGQDDVAIEVPSRTFDVAFPRARRLLLWWRMQVVRRRFVVAGLPIRELLVMHSKLHQLGQEFPHLSAAEACVAILGTRDALMLVDKKAREIWEWWHEANLMPVPTSADPGPYRAEGPSPVMDLVFKLQRSPFNFSEARVMGMTVAEAFARLDELERTNLAAYAAMRSAARA